MAGLASFVQGFQGGVDVAHSWQDRKRAMKAQDEDRAFLAENRDWARGDRAYTLEERARLRTEQDRQLKLAQDERDAAAAAFGNGPGAANAPAADPNAPPPNAGLDPLAGGIGSGAQAPGAPALSFGPQIGTVAAPGPGAAAPPPPGPGAFANVPPGAMPAGDPRAAQMAGMAGRGLPPTGMMGRTVAPPMPPSFAQSQIGRQIAAQNNTSLEAAWAGLAPTDQQTFYQMPADPSFAPPQAVLTGQQVPPGTIPGAVPPVTPRQASLMPGPGVPATAPPPVSATSGGGGVVTPPGGNVAGPQAGARLVVPGITPPAGAAAGPQIAALTGAATPPVPGPGVAAPGQGQGQPLGFGRSVTRTPAATQTEVTAINGKVTDGMQAMVDFYMKTDQFEKAKAMKDWMRDEKSQGAMELWSKAFHSYVIGDEKGMLDNFANYYNTLGLGVTVDRSKSSLVRDPKTNAVTGVHVTYTDAQGQSQSTDMTMSDVLQEGIMALTPQKAFETIYAQKGAAAKALADQQGLEARIIVAQIRANGGSNTGAATPARVHKAMAQLLQIVPNFANLPEEQKIGLAVQMLQAENKAVSTMNDPTDPALDPDTGDASFPIAYGPTP